MQCVIDRFEEDYAVIEHNGRVMNLPKNFLPVEAHEGDVLDVIILLDDVETKKLKAETQKLMENVWGE